MRGASADSLALLKEQLTSLVGAEGVDAGELGQELFAVTRTLDGQGRLLRILTDYGTSAERKARLVAAVYAPHLSETALDVLQGTVRHAWSHPDDLVDGLEDLGITAVLAAATAHGDLATAEDELFQVSRLIDDDPGLWQAYDSLAGRAADRVALTERVFGGKASDVTLVLIRQAVALHSTEQAAARIMGFADEVTALRRRTMAVVTSARPLEQHQQDRLASILNRVYGRQVQLILEVDPAVVGGCRIRVGDEVFDASIESKLAVARRRIAG